MAITITNSVGKTLRDKAKELDEEIERHHAAIKTLEADRAAIFAARDTLMRLGVIQTVDVTPAFIGSGKVKKTVPEMILDVLQHDFPTGSEPQGVLMRIKDKFDPNADPNNVRPTMWRMAKDGRLEKSRELYRLPQKNEAAGSPQPDAPTASAQERPKWARSAHPA